MDSDLSTILKQIFLRMGFNIRQAYDYLEAHGVSVSYAALATYQKGNSVPDFSRAKQILSAFDYVIDDSDLQSLLDMSRERMRERNEYDSVIINTSIRIRPEYFGSVSASDLLFIIRSRVSTYPEADGSMNKYLNLLIQKDLIESGYMTRGKEMH